MFQLENSWILFGCFFFELNWNRRLQSGSNSKKIDKVKLLTYWCTKLPRLSTLAVKNGLYSFYFFYYLCVNPRSVQTNLNKQELSVRIVEYLVLFFFSIFIFCFTRKNVKTKIVWLDKNNSSSTISIGPSANNWWIILC